MFEREQIGVANAVKITFRVVDTFAADLYMRTEINSAF